MSRYVRTKDRVFELTGGWAFLDATIEQIINNEKAYETVQPPHFLKEVDIVKDADTIEELCDCYVIIDLRKNHFVVGSLDQTKELATIWTREGVKEYTIFGAIWTDKGLLYVANMNNNGELELL